MGRNVASGVSAAGANMTAGAEFGVKSDRELIDAINRGDPDAFETLYHRYRDWVCRLAWRFTGNHQDALDVLQETFMYLLKKFPGFKLTASMTALLYPVVKHLALNLRRRKSAGPIDEGVLGEIPTAASPRAPRSELAAAMSALPREQREVVLMRFVDDMPLAEIAAALQIPVNTAKSRLYSALQKLRDDRRTCDYFLG